MHALGIPTTRALAAVSTGEPVYRDRRLPGRCFTRVASSHIRVGTFQYFAARGDAEASNGSPTTSIDRHIPDAPRSREAVPRAASGRRGTTGAADRALDACRVHPWRDEHRQHGAFGRDDRFRAVRLHGSRTIRRPCSARSTSSVATPTPISRPIAQWNLARFAETLLPLLDREPERAVELASEAVSAFAVALPGALACRHAREAGLSGDEDGDLDLARDMARKRCMRMARTSR